MGKGKYGGARNGQRCLHIMKRVDERGTNKQGKAKRRADNEEEAAPGPDASKDHPSADRHHEQDQQPMNPLGFGQNTRNRQKRRHKR